MSTEKSNCMSLILVLLTINTLLLAGIFLKLSCGSMSFCPMKKGGMFCPITGKSLSQPAAPAAN